MRMIQIARAMKHHWRWLGVMLTDNLRFDTAPGDCIVRYRRVAPLDSADANVTVFGSGRIEVVRTGQGDAQQGCAGQLNPAALAELLGALLTSGLAHFDALRLARERHCMRRQASPLGTQPLPCTDLSRSEIQLTLCRMGATRNIRHVVDVTLCAVQDEAAAFPEWTTIASYAAADRRLRALIDHPSLRATLAPVGSAAGNPFS